MMRLLATFPDLGTPAATDAAAVGPPLVSLAPTLPPEPDSADSAAGAGDVGRPLPLPTRTIRVSPKKAFPWASVAALLTVAAAVWSLASWNDARRLARQEAEPRLADRCVTAPAEAVLR